MANFFGTAGADSITGTGNVGFNGGVGTLADFDIVWAGDGADTVLGNPSNGLALFVFGGNGNDSIVGGGSAMANGAGSNSVLRGDDGNDTIVGGPSGGNLLLDGGTGNDSLVAGANSFGLQMLGGMGSDTLVGGIFNDRIDGGEGNDSISGGGGFNIIEGGSGDNTIDGGFSGSLISAVSGNANLLLGGDQQDTILGGRFNDTISGGGGSDVIEAGDGANSISGGSFDDRITAGSGNDAIAGDDGNDLIYAGGGNNTVAGGNGNDSIVTDLNADSVDGGEGNDFINLGAGADTALGGNGNDVLDGGDGADRLDGGAGNDAVLAGGGGDTVLGGRGFDRLDGGLETDTLDFSSGTGVERIILSLPTSRLVKHVAGGGIEHDFVQNFEAFVGTAGHDRFTGWGEDETFTGGAGNDTFDGGDGFDTIRYDVAGAGNVTVNLRLGFALDGLGGRDLIRRSEVSDASIEFVIAGAGDDTLTGDADSNFLRGGHGADSIDGGEGGDHADWSGDTDLNGDGFGVAANLGATTLSLASWGTEGPVTVAGGIARDASAAADRLANIENLRGTAMRDLLVGSAGDNFFRGMQGADTIDGGAGQDHVSHRSDADANGDGFGVVVNLSDSALVLSAFGSEGAVSVAARTARDGWGTLDTLIGIESAVGTMANDHLNASPRPIGLQIGAFGFGVEDRSYLRGLAGNDTLSADAFTDGAMADHHDDVAGVTVRLDLGWAEDGWGNRDTLIRISGASGSMMDDLLVAATTGSRLRGRAGDDMLMGGAGLDSAAFVGVASGAHAVLGAGTLAGTAQDGEGGTDVLIDIENLIGTNLADTLIGNEEDNLIFGSRGADSMDGGLGEDLLAYYSAWQEGAVAPSVEGVLVNLATGTARDGDGSAGGGSLDRFTGFEHVVGTHLGDTLIGSTLANTLVGAEGDDTLNGGVGNDTLVGGTGNDRLEGWTGNDQLNGGAGDDLILVNSRFDVVVEEVGGGNDTVRATNSYALTDGVEVELLELLGALALSAIGNSFDNELAGNSGANTLNGGAGSDSLFGNDGADRLIGSTGADELTGGGDADRFFFDRAGDSNRGILDRIADFEVGVDQIGFSALAGRLFAGVTPTGIDLNGLITVASADLGTGITSYAAVMAGINAVLGGAANVTASAGDLQLWEVEVAGGTAAGRYLFVNDRTAGASATSDMLIGLTLVGGTQLTAADLVLG